MAHKQTAFNQIKRYGYKGAAVLVVKSKVEDPIEKTNTTIIQSEIDLLAFVGRYPLNRISNTSINQDDRRVLIALDSDFTGSIGSDDTIKVEGLELSIVSKIEYKINEDIAYIEVQARG